MEAVQSRGIGTRFVPRGGLCEKCQVRGETSCSALDNSELVRLASITVPKRLNKGQTLFNEGEEARFAFNIRSGVLRLVNLLPDGTRHVIGFGFPGDMLGFTTHGDYTCSAETLEPVEACAYPRDKLLPMLDETPPLKTMILNMAISEIDKLQKQTLLLAHKSAIARVATFLWHLYDENTKYRNVIRCTGGRVEIDLSIPRRDIADHLGITVETTSRCFSRLREDGVICLERPNHVVILMPDVLQEMAQSHTRD